MEFLLKGFLHQTGYFDPTFQLAQSPQLLRSGYPSHSHEAMKAVICLETFDAGGWTGPSSNVANGLTR